jgi:hypothetical protein
MSISPVVIRFVLIDQADVTCNLREEHWLASPRVQEDKSTSNSGWNLNQGSLHTRYSSLCTEAMGPDNPSQSPHLSTGYFVLDNDTNISALFTTKLRIIMTCPYTSSAN